MNTRSLMFCLAASSTLIANAATWTVYHENHKPVKSGQEVAGTTEMTPIEQLVYAIKNSSGNDSVLIKPGEYDLSGLEPTDKGDGNGASYLVIDSKKLTLKGEDTTDWSLKTPQQETILKGGTAARIVYGYAGGGRASVFQHLTFDGGHAQSGKNGGAILFGHVGDKGGYATNCVFRNCSAADSGATHYLSAYNCCYSNNTATTRGGAAKCYQNTHSFIDCVFVENSARAGGALSSSNSLARVSGCVFVGNRAGLNGGAIEAPTITTITGCSFTDNTAESKCGGIYVSEELSGTIEACTFHNSACANDQVGAHFQNVNSVVRCQFSGTGDASAKSFDSCEFNACIYTNFRSQTSLDALVRFNTEMTGDGLVRNCLFQNCTLSTLLSSAGVRVDIENCTFADNECSYNVFYAFRKDVSGKASLATTNSFVNCVFANAKPGQDNGAACDFYATSFKATSCTLVSNSIFSTKPAGEPLTSGGFVTSDFLLENPKFVAGSEYYPQAPYYMLNPSSKGHKVGGVVLDWMATATDLAGNARLSGGKVDMGCYQCNLPPTGLIVVFK